jgi:hypothetical protein
VNFVRKAFALKVVKLDSTRKTYSGVIRGGKSILSSYQKIFGWRENEKTKCMNEIDMKKEIN